MSQHIRTASSSHLGTNVYVSPPAPSIDSICTRYELSFNVKLAADLSGLPVLSIRESIIIHIHSEESSPPFPKTLEVQQRQSASVPSSSHWAHTIDGCGRIQWARRPRVMVHPVLPCTVHVADLHLAARSPPEIPCTRAPSSPAFVRSSITFFPSRERTPG